MKQPHPHIDDPKAVGRRIAELRERAGISQRELATATDCSGAYVSRIEAGDRAPSKQMVEAFARTLGTSADYLLSGEDTLTVTVTVREIDEAMGLWTSGRETSPLQLADLTEDERGQLEQVLRSAVLKGTGGIARAIQVSREVAAETEERRRLEAEADDGRAREEAAAALERAAEEAVA